MVVVAGIAYKSTATRFLNDYSRPNGLSSVLAEFPMKIGNWVGTDISVSDSDIVDSEDGSYLIRSYINQQTSKKISLYISNLSKPRSIRDFKSDIFVPKKMQVENSQVAMSVALDSGRELPCRVQRFPKVLNNDGDSVVLKFYIINGIPIEDMDMHSRLEFRNIDYQSHHTKYAAQVQISSDCLETTISAVKEFGDLILKYLTK